MYLSPHDNLSQYDHGTPQLPPNMALLRMDRALNHSSHTGGEAESLINSKVFRIDSGRLNTGQMPFPSNIPARSYDIDLNNFEAFRKAAQPPASTVLRDGGGIGNRQGHPIVNSPPQPQHQFAQNHQRADNGLLNLLGDSRLSNQAEYVPGAFQNEPAIDLSLASHDAKNGFMNNGNPMERFTIEASSLRNSALAPIQPTISRPAIFDNPISFRPSTAQPQQTFGIPKESEKIDFFKGNEPVMLLDDESSIIDHGEEEMKMQAFNNPFFKNVQTVNEINQSKRAALLKGNKNASIINYTPDICKPLRLT